MLLCVCLYMHVCLYIWCRTCKYHRKHGEASCSDNEKVWWGSISFLDGKNVMVKAS